MAHELEIFANGRASMAFVGETPWHGLGQQLSANAPIEVWRREAHLDWDIHRSPVQYKNGTLHEFPEQHVLYRSDTNAPLAVVSKRYKEVQPGEVLEFFRDLIDGSGFSIETAGTLKGGRRIWALARTGYEAEVVARDSVKSYLLLATSCDGTIATTAQFTSVRVVCNNTLQMSLNRASGDQSADTVVRVRHNTEFDPNVVKEQLGLIGKQVFDEFMGRMQALSQKPFSVADADAVLRTLFSKTTHDDVTESKGYKSVMNLFNGAGRGATLDGVEGTAWGLLNAVTEYYDYHTRSRSAANRLDSAWFGQGAAQKAVALQVIEASC